VRLVKQATRADERLDVGWCVHELVAAPLIGEDVGESGARRLHLGRQAEHLDGALVAYRDGAVGGDHHEALAHELQRGFEHGGLLGDEMLALGQRIRGAAQFGGLHLQSLLGALEIGVLLRQRPFRGSQALELAGQNDEHQHDRQHDRQRTERDRERLAAPFDERRLAGHADVDDQGIVAQRLHRNVAWRAGDPVLRPPILRPPILRPPILRPPILRPPILRPEVAATRGDQLVPGGALRDPHADRGVVVRTAQQPDAIAPGDADLASVHQGDGLVELLEIAQRQGRHDEAQQSAVRSVDATREAN
jgi:hypothetical protein